MAEVLIEITAPDSASEGIIVPVNVQVKNITTFDYYFKVEIYAGVSLLLSDSVIIAPGSTRGWDRSFIMPASDITILVWVERWSINYWKYVNAVSKVVLLELPIPPSEFSNFGVISFSKA